MEKDIKNIGRDDKNYLKMMNNATFLQLLFEMLRLRKGVANVQWTSEHVFAKFCGREFTISVESRPLTLEEIDGEDVQEGY